MEDISLTSQERHQLMSVLREMDDHAPAESRKGARHKVELKTSIRVIGQRKTSRVPATLMNVAPEGAGLTTSTEIEEGKRFLLNLRFREGGGWLVLCEVRNCARLEDGKFKIGGRFVEKIEDPKGDGKPPLDWLL